MKTTIELPDALVRSIKVLAASEGTSMRTIVEQALVRELERRRSESAWQPRPDLVFGGGGFAEAEASMTWDEIRMLASREDLLAAEAEPQ